MECKDRMSNSPLLSIQEATKYYGAHRALFNVSLDLDQGEVLCIVGENGAGKSTLIKILSGAIQPDNGTVTVQGKEYGGLSPRQAMQLGVATIYQDVELIDSLTVADNIFLGNEHRSFRFLVDAKSQFAKAREILDSLHIDIDERKLVGDLSAAEQQTLQIVKALHQDSRVLIMDEPTSSLGLEETRSLMELIRNLRSHGIGIIYISHYLEEIFEIGDRILILKDGERVGTYDREELDADNVVRKMVGRDASVFFQREEASIGAPRVEVRNMTLGHTVQDVSFDIRAGEIFGIGGLVGAGRTELVELIYGLVKPEKGETRIDGTRRRIESPADAIRHGICLVSEDRHKQGMFTNRSVIENITVVHNERVGKKVVSSSADERAARAMIQDLRIATADPWDVITGLSGGNQQKAVVARWLLDESILYIFDEPTKGVDVGAKQEIYKIMVRFAQAGKCVLMISSDMPELISMSDRIGVMRRGQMTQVLEKSEASEENLIRLFMGVGNAETE